MGSLENVRFLRISSSKLSVDEDGLRVVSLLVAVSNAFVIVFFVEG